MTDKSKAVKAGGKAAAPAEKPAQEERKSRPSDARLEDLERMGLDPRPYGLAVHKGGG